MESGVTWLAIALQYIESGIDWYQQTLANLRMTGRQVLAVVRSNARKSAEQASALLDVAPARCGWADWSGRRPIEHGHTG